jgi:hypothetical protein
MGMRKNKQCLWLRSHVHACTTPSAIVFLDLRRDVYLSLALRHLSALESLIGGWPRSTPQSGAEPETGMAAAEVAQLLLQRELVTADEGAGRSANPATTAGLALPSVPFQDIFLRQRSPEKVSAVDVCRFLRACLRARSLLSAGIESAVSRVATRNAGNACAPTDEDLRHALATTLKFRRLRIWFFKADGHCLLHALALIEFLACYRIYPCLVLGVRTDHWGAHSWVQLRDCVLDSSPERARFYTPILVA